MEENLEEISSKIGKNYLCNKGQSANKYLELLGRKDYQLDEMFLVLIAKSYKRHVCVLLENGGVWCTTQWIQMKDCAMVLVACMNEVDKMRYFSATCELVTQEGITDSKKMHQQEASTKFEQEMEHFIRSVPEKVPIRSTSEIRKRSVECEYKVPKQKKLKYPSLSQSHIWEMTR